MSIAGKTIVLTGSSGGIGEEAAQHLARAAAAGGAARGRVAAGGRDCRRRRPRVHLSLRPQRPGGPGGHGGAPAGRTPAHRRAGEQCRALHPPPCRRGAGPAARLRAHHADQLLCGGEPDAEVAAPLPRAGAGPSGERLHHVDAGADSPDLGLPGQQVGAGVVLALAVGGARRSRPGGDSGVLPDGAHRHVEQDRDLPAHAHDGCGTRRGLDREGGGRAAGAGLEPGRHAGLGIADGAAGAGAGTDAAGRSSGAWTRSWRPS